MKKLFFLIIFLWMSTLAIHAQTTIPSANDILKEALVQASKEKKNVIIIFHASWCVWCHRMDSSMNDASCQNFFNDNFIVRHLTVDESKDKKDLENPGANELRNKYGGKDQGIPFWLVYDPNGNLLATSLMNTQNSNNDVTGENVGCPATEKEVAYFISVLKKSSKMNATQQAAIEKRFRQNDAH